jgi:hypothetical protein
MITEPLNGWAKNALQEFETLYIGGAEPAVVRRAFVGYELAEPRLARIKTWQESRLARIKTWQNQGLAESRLGQIKTWSNQDDARLRRKV